MEINEFKQLEEKINHMVANLKKLQEENLKLKTQLKDYQKVSHSYDRERDSIKKKITSLIEIIDTIEK